MLRFGVVSVVIFITIISMLSSTLMTAIIFSCFEEELTRAGIFASLFIPFIIAPVVTWFLANAVLESHSLKEKMQDLATVDLLTGVKTRRALMDAAYSYYKIAVRNKHVFSVVLLDLDNFKTINDTFGHLVGDEVLKSIGKIFCESIRTSDIAGRYGGDEFMFILPGVGRENVNIFAEKLLNEISYTVVEHNDSKVNTTVSIGVAIYDENNNATKFENLLDQSDKMLFEAKRKGRNCIVIHQ